MLFHFFRRLGRDTSGIGFIELALVTPLLGLLFLGMFDTSRIVQTCLDLEQAAQRTTDFALAQRPRDGDASAIEAEARNASGAPDEDITVELIHECGGVAQSTFTGTCTPGALSKRFVRVAIQEEVNTGMNWRLFGAWFDGGSTDYIPVTVTGDSVVRLQ